MKMVQLPDFISYISEELFMNCTSLEKIIIPKNVTEIRKKAFYNCKNLKELVLPEGIIHIGTEALKGVNLNIVKTQPGSFAEEFIANLQGKN